MDTQSVVLSLGAGAVIAWLLLRARPGVPRPRLEERGRPVGPILRVTMTDRRPEAATSSNGDDFWQPLTLIDQASHGGIYAGQGLAAASGNGLEPALVDPALPVDRSVQDCTLRRLDYWPSYAGASPQARAAYLHWLANGRQDPSADLGYVFLYFYGLERRVLHDALVSAAAKAELQSIQAELERLLGIYASSASFQAYAGSLLDILQADRIPTRRYEQAPPPLRRGRDLTFEHRIALAQCAADGKPLPAEWAYTWFVADPTTSLRTPATRCPDEFRRLFLASYRGVFGDGIRLPQNRTRLKLEHRPASPTFAPGMAECARALDLPDVTVLSGPVKELQKIAESCYSRLASYSRFVRNHKELANTFDALVELPLELWPTALRVPLDDGRTLVEHSGGTRPLPFAELSSWFPSVGDISTKKLRAFGRVLGEAGLGMEPDARFGSGTPSADTTVVLFSDDPPTATAEPGAAYSAAALMLQLGAAVAVADGESSGTETGLLARQLGDQLHLKESERRRLQARLQLMLLVPPKLTGLKTRVNALDAAQRDAIGEFLALVALADGLISPAEIKTLEKVFRLLGLEPQSVYSKVHVAATEPVTVAPGVPAQRHPIPRPPSAGSEALASRLDPGKIAALQKDSERVATILRSIFQETIPLEPAPEPAGTDSTGAEEASLMGLRPDHAAFVQTLLTRARWTRAELEDIASERGLMLDGVLEQVNEAAFERFDKLLLEGDDPVEVNHGLVREMIR